MLLLEQETQREMASRIGIGPGRRARGDRGRANGHQFLPKRGVPAIQPRPRPGDSGYEPELKENVIMKPIKFDRDATRAIVGEIQDYFRDELDQSIGAIPAEMLMQFFADKMGAYFYNQGLHDAQALVRKQIDNLSDDIFALEQVTRRVR